MQKLPLSNVNNFIMTLIVLIGIINFLDLFIIIMLILLFKKLYKMNIYKKLILTLKKIKL